MVCEGQLRPAGPFLGVLVTHATIFRFLQFFCNFLQFFAIFCNFLQFFATFFAACFAIFFAIFSLFFTIFCIFVCLLAIFCTITRRCHAGTIGRRSDGIYHTILHHILYHTVLHYNGRHNWRNTCTRTVRHHPKPLMWYFCTLH